MDGDVVHSETYKHLDATQAKPPGPTSDVMVWYDETSWNMLQVYCI